MSKATPQDRLAAKTPESAFLHVLQEEFNFSSRVSRELLSTAKEMLVGGAPSSAVRPGQVRLVVASLKAPFGPPLSKTEKVEVTLTVDAGPEDAEVKAQQRRRACGRGGFPGQDRQSRECRNDGGNIAQITCTYALPLA